jgi:hypothetical protein
LMLANEPLQDEQFDPAGNAPMGMSHIAKKTFAANDAFARGVIH